MATSMLMSRDYGPPFDGFVVDGFNVHEDVSGVRHWLLTHAHSDHTCGLSGGLMQVRYTARRSRNGSWPAGRLGASRRTHGRHQRGRIRYTSRNYRPR